MAPRYVLTIYIFFNKWENISLGHFKVIEFLLYAGNLYFAFHFIAYLNLYKNNNILYVRLL